MRILTFLLIVPAICFTCFSSATAQMPSFKIKGKIVDESTEAPLEFATIAVKKVRDSSLVSGTITNDKGEFEISDLPPGAMNIEFAFIGYESVTQKLILKPQGTAPVTDMGTIKLKVSATMLEGAEITAEKSFVINQIDKKTYNTDQLSVVSGGNVKDILENIPSVEVDGDGVVSLRGNENVTILIDGRPSGLTGSGGKSLLESIPSSAIENVEIITNPSAKYDPDGISGIINIITKKNKLQGFTGSVGVNTSFENRYGGNLSLAYKHGKWNIYSLYGFNKNVRDFTGDTYKQTFFNDITNTIIQDETSTDKSIDQNAKLGVDFNANDNNTISISGLVNGGTGTDDELNIYRNFNQFGIQDSLYKRSSSSDESDLNFDFDLNWIHRFKQKGRQLNFLATASLATNDNDAEYTEAAYLNDETPAPYLPLFQRDQEDNINNVYTAALDYEHPIGEDKKIEAGYKSTIRHFDSDYRAQTLDYDTGEFLNDVNLTNQFIYDDQLHAGYAQYRQSINKFGFQVGVRSEYATTESELVTTNEIFSKDYFSIFPSAFATYKPDQKTQWKATYSKRINRPSRRTLNPFANYEDPQNIRKGNPFLDPEYTDSYELEYNRIFGKISFIATGYMRLTTDNISRYREVTPEGVTITTYKNLTSEDEYGLELILNGSLYKWWTFTFSSNMYWHIVDGTNLEDDLSSESFSIGGRIFTTFKLPYKTDLQLSYFYRAPGEFPQGQVKEFQAMNIAASKKILKDKGVITIRLSDPFNTQRFRLIYEDATFYQDFTRKRESRILTLSFTYRFGEFRDKNARQGRDQGGRDNMDFED